MVAGMIVLAALGSSFASGPTLPPYADPSRGQSQLNYPHLLANATQAQLFDLSTSGATTSTVLSGQVPYIPANTTLVTVTAGGNDLGLVGYIQYTAANSINPSSNLSRTLRPRFGGPIKAPNATQINATATGLVNIVQQSRAKAPGATVILAEYLSILQPPLNANLTTYFNSTSFSALYSIQTALVQAFESAAKQTGAPLLNMTAMSASHSAGTSQPWVATLKSDTDGAEGSFHPTYEGMQAVATALQAMPAVQSAIANVPISNIRSAASRAVNPIMAVREVLKRPRGHSKL